MAVNAQFYVTPNVGYVNGTNFTFTNTTYGSEIKQYIWDFGDGNVQYNIANPSHVYKYPGLYTVTLSAYGYDGSISVNNTTLSANYMVRDYISFTGIPDSYGTPGQISKEPFQIYVQSAQINTPITVQLFADNSPSLPYEFKKGKWDFLTPTWFFTDKDYNITDQLTIDTVPIYAPPVVSTVTYNQTLTAYINGTPTLSVITHTNTITSQSTTPVGVSGFGSFHFKDDISIGDPTVNCPLVIIATLLTSAFNVPVETTTYKYPSYSNTTVTRATILWQVSDYKPDYFNVTGNYIDNISPSKWKGYPIPVMITAASDPANRFRCATEVPSVTSGILYNFPSSNAVGKTSELQLTIKDDAGNLIPTNVQPNLFFQQTDSNGFETGGYIFTTITPTATATNATIHATLLPNESPDLPHWDFPYAGGYGPVPAVWIANPENKDLVKINCQPYPANCKTVTKYADNGTLIDIRISQSFTPYVKATPKTTFNYGMSGYSGIFSTSIFPGDNTVVAADAELDCLYRIKSVGTTLSTLNTLQLSSITHFNPLTAGVTPAYTSIDYCGNTWVSLFNSVSVLKFDYNFNLLAVAVPSGINSGTIFDSGFNTYGDNLLKPAIVETDTFNNIWVTYSHPVCSMLVQYDSNGNSIQQINLGNNTVPQAMAINKFNQIWIANSYNVEPNMGNFTLYGYAVDQNPLNLQASFNPVTLLSSISAENFYRPTYMCLDRHNNPWFTHGVRNIGMLDRSTGALSGWYVSPNSNQTLDNIFVPFSNAFQFDETGGGGYTYPEVDPDFAARYDEELGGIAIDAYNRLWVIDSQTNNVFLLTATPIFNTSSYRNFNIQPATNIGFLNNIANTFTYTVTASAYKSAQATGDWTGNRWFQKYANFTQPITGYSNEFNIYDFNNSFDLRRLNESFDTAAYYKSLALPDILNQNTNLFDNFFGAAVGTAAPSATDDLGQKSYERIANFVSNHSDVDTCNVQQLISLAQSFDLSASNFGNIYPSDIQNMLDIASIPRSKLWGLPKVLPLQPDTEYASRNNPLDTSTAYVTAGSKIYYQSIYDPVLKLGIVPTLTIPVTGINNKVTYSTLSVYPLTQYPGLPIPNVELNYRFYQYTPIYDGTYKVTVYDETNTVLLSTFDNHLAYPDANQIYLNLLSEFPTLNINLDLHLPTFIESVIDWNSPYTTIDRSLSSASDLYKDGGVIETMFNYFLTKNLILN